MQHRSLPALLSQGLIAFSLEFDGELAVKAQELGIKKTPPSLMMWLNVLRFVGEGGVDDRRLPELSGISKPATRISIACLERHGWIAVESDPSDKHAKIVRLTPRARKLSSIVSEVIEGIEKRWSANFDIAPLRSTLEALADPELPQYPVVLPNRGGTPTGL